MGIKTKICGIKSVDAVHWVCDGGADFIGFISFAKSPRHIDNAKAALLASHVDAAVKKVAVVVNAPKHELAEFVDALEPDFIQLHGQESPEGVEDIKKTFGCRVIKALAISGVDDLEKAKQYDAVADILLFDAKPPVSSVLPGGNGVSFDWSLLEHSAWNSDWFVSGGIHINNVEEAINISGASFVDVSSGVESKPGVKDQALIKQFLTKVSAI